MKWESEIFKLPIRIIGIRQTCDHLTRFYRFVGRCEENGGYGFEWAYVRHQRVYLFTSTPEQPAWGYRGSKIRRVF